jgi:hypothetical protein
MKVFISWSGELSRKLAEVFRNWLPVVVQAVRPYFTPDDVEKGARWGQEISKELAASSFGIFCLTPDNLEAPWILFEAGALAKQLDKSRVCPILFGPVENTDLRGPLVQFQAAKFSNTEIKKLLHGINSQAEEGKLESAVLDRVFEMWWPQLDKDIARVLEEFRAATAKKIRSDRELLEEILQLLRFLTTRTTLPCISPTLAHQTASQLVHWYSELHKELVPILDDSIRGILERLRYAIQVAISLIDEGGHLKSYCSALDSLSPVSPREPRHEGPR